MAQRTGLIALAAMTITGRSDGTTVVPLPIIAAAAQMTRTARCALCFALGANGPVRSRRVVAHFLRLGPQAEKPWAVPPDAGDQTCNFGEVAKGLALIGKPFRQHHDAVTPAVPFPDKDRARLDPAR